MKKIILASMLVICLCAHAAAVPGILPVEKAVDTNLAANEQTTAALVSETNKCGENITWTLENGVLTLTGTGATYNYSADEDYTKNPPPWFGQRDEITEIKLSEGITELGNFSLVGCTAIQTITLPSTLKAIGERVFMDWISLVSIELPDGLCVIGEGAFEWNDMFSKIVIPKSVTSIADGAFECCGRLTIYGYTGSVAHTYATENNIPFTALEEADSSCGENLTWQFDSSSGTLTISGNGEMYDYSNINLPWKQYSGKIESVVFGEGVTGISNYAFAWHTKLSEVCFSSTLQTIYESSFYNCSSLENITVPEESKYFASDDAGVLYNKDKSELYLYPLGSENESFTLPSSVSSITDRAFVNAKNLKSFSVAVGSKNYTAKDGVLFSANMDTLVSYPYARQDNSYIIPSGTEEIAGFAFENCPNLTNVSFPDSLKTIGKLAFAGSAITSADLPENVTDIKHQAFDWCHGLISAVLPTELYEIPSEMFDSCTSLKEIELPKYAGIIGGYSFSNCTSLEKVIIYNDVKIIEEGAFEGCDKLTIYGYEDSVAQKYAADNEIPFVSMGKPSIADNKEVKKLTSAILGNLQDIGGELAHTLNYYVGDDDINGEPKINIKDLIALAQMLSENNG